MKGTEAVSQEKKKKKKLPRRDVPVGGRGAMSPAMAIKYVKASLEQLERFARGVRGAVLPETKEAFRVLIKMARKATTKSPTRLKVVDVSMTRQVERILDPVTHQLTMLIPRDGSQRVCLTLESEDGTKYTAELDPSRWPFSPLQE